MNDPWRIPVKFKRSVIVLSMMQVSVLASAQSLPSLGIPDAGRVLQTPPAPVQPTPASPELTGPTQMSKSIDAGGAQVRLSNIVISGNSKIDNADLQRFIDTYVGYEFDFKGLNGIADSLTEYYRSRGYPFAKAFLPPQTVDKGVLTIEVVEGRFGQIETSGDLAYKTQGARFLQRIRPGDVIEGKALERAVLILGDLPGVDVVSSIKPGSDVGTGDLLVEVQQVKRFNGELGVDNHGSRYTGTQRVNASFSVSDLAFFGDQVQAGIMKSADDLWLGSASYAMPFGTDGLRGQLTFAKTEYSLGKEFARLNASGQATVYGLSLSYPLIRSLNANVYMSSSFQHKKLSDETVTPAGYSAKYSNVVPLAIQFDRRDTWADYPGVTYGAVTATYGQLALDAALRKQDAASAKTQGSFVKMNLDVARMQALPNQWHASMRLAGQWANKNLDSSEGFTLGGVNGVRAYPQGDFSGDMGALVQLEMKYSPSAWNGLSPYLFFDSGFIRRNTEVFQAGDNRLSASGSGLGVRYTQGHFSANVLASWRLGGRKQESGGPSRTPVVLASTTWRF